MPDSTVPASELYLLPYEHWQFREPSCIGKVMQGLARARGKRFHIDQRRMDVTTTAICLCSDDSADLECASRSGQQVCRSAGEVTGAPMNSRSTVSYASRYDRIPRGVARYGFGEWDRALGNHRAVIRVTAAAEAVYAYLPWRRRDAFPHAKHVMIVDAQSGNAVDNSVVANCNREYGEVVFQPTSGIGLYYAYYLIPTNDRSRWVWPRSSFPITIYESPRTAASPVWRKKFHVSTDDIGSTPDPSKIPWQSSSSYPAPWRDLPEAELVEFQSSGEWHSFYPMEIIATLEEKHHLVNRSGARPFILFPETRDHPIRMNKDIPHHWAVRKNEELDQFEATVQKNEYFVFQLGVYAFREMLPNLKVTWSSLPGPGGARIAASAITCFNLSGINQHGRPFVKTLHVAQKEVQALWFGVDIPKNAKPGHYEGTVTVASQDTVPQSVVLRLQVVNKMMVDRGDGDSNRLSRLRWLNSKHAVDDLVCAPYTPVSVRGRIPGDNSANPNAPWAAV